jgi:hypothetical protein
MEQFRKVELEFVFVARCVRALNFAELALKALIDDLVFMRFLKFANVTIAVVNRLEKVGEGVTELKAHPATMTDLYGSGHFLV